MPPPAIEHDLAVLSIKAPKTVNLTATKPSLTKRVIVQIQNPQFAHGNDHEPSRLGDVGRTIARHQLR